MPIPKILNHFLESSDEIYSISSGELVHFKNMQSDWLRAFWPISREQDFSQI